MNPRYRIFFTSLWMALLLIAAGNRLAAQAYVAATATADARQITVGDQARVFLEVQNKPALSSVQWPVIPDSFGKLEVVERGRIDTVKKGDLVYYKQRLIVTGFDSGVYYVPSFQFGVVPKSGAAYTLNTDSLPFLVQTVAVDTTKAYKPIKGILEVKSTWLDYIWLIIGGAVLLILAVIVIWYFLRNKGAKVPVKEEGPKETLQEKAQRLLAELDAKQLWQKGQVKEYYVQLTEIVRGYIEARFDTPALEITTDELIEKARRTKDIIPVAGQLETILHTADLAKFAKAQPTPQEHVTAMDLAKVLITATRPVIIETPSNTPQA